MAATIKYANYDKSMHVYSFGTLTTELKSLTVCDGSTKVTLSMTFVRSRDIKVYATIVDQDMICSSISNSDPMAIKEWLPNAKHVVAPDRLCTIIFGHRAMVGRIIRFVLKEVVDSLEETQKQITDLTRELTGLKTVFATCVNMAYDSKPESDGAETSVPAVVKYSGPVVRSKK